MQQTANPKSSFISNNLPFLLLGLALTWMYLSFYVFEARFKINLQTDKVQSIYGEMRTRIQDIDAFKAEMLTKYDADGDGKLSDDERKTAHETEKQELLEKYDADGNGELEGEERKQAGEWMRENRPFHLMHHGQHKRGHKGCKGKKRDGEKRDGKGEGERKADGTL